MRLKNIIDLKTLIAVTFLVLFSTFSSSQTFDSSVFVNKGLDASYIEPKSYLKDEVLPSKESFKLSHFIDSDTVYLTWNMPKGYYLYKDKISVLESKSNTDLVLNFLSNSTIANDDFFGSVKVFRGEMSAEIKIPENMYGDLDLSVKFQGCASGRLCYPPENRQLKMFIDPGVNNDKGLNSIATEGLYYKNTEITSKPYNTNYYQKYNDRKSGEEPSWLNASASEIYETIYNTNSFFVVFIFFMLGLALTFTPCVLPMIPIISSVVVGSEAKTKQRSALLSTSYVLGMALTYTALGLIVGVFGASWNIQAMFQNPYIISFIASVFVLLSLAMFGVFEIKLPTAFYRFGASSKGGSPRGAFIIGSVSAVAVSPCVSAPLAGALIYLSATGDVILSGLSLFFLSIGMGIPLIIVGTFGKSILPKSGEWMVLVKNLLGYMLLATGIWMIERIINEPFAMFLWGVWGLSLSILIVSFGIKSSLFKFIYILIGCVIAAWSLFVLAGAASGSERQSLVTPLKVFWDGKVDAGNSEHELFEIIIDSSNLDDLIGKDRPALVDLYADWCVSCIVMDKEVFSKERVRALKDHIDFVKLDISDFTQDHKEFMNKYEIFGPPAMIFFDESGDLIKSATLHGETDVDEFMDHIRTNILNNMAKD